MARRLSFGNLVVIAFLLVQAIDGIFTYLGILRFGVGIEANPIVAWYVTAFGAGIAVLFVKLLAVACAAALHLQARHATLGALTAFYVIAALGPWTAIFALVF